MVKTIFVLHILNGFAAVFLAEVHVKIGHVNTLGVQETLKQEIKLYGVKIGNSEWPSHNGACTGTTPRANRHPMPFWPLDKICHDEEVPGEPHFFDNAELIFQAVVIFLVYFSLLLGRHALKIDVFFHPFSQTFVGFLVNIFILGEPARTFKNRQQWLHFFRQIVATLGNIDGAFQSLGQVSKKLHHFSLGAQPVVGREFFSVFIGNIFGRGNTNQGIVRLIHIHIKEERLIGCHQGNVVFIGPVNEGIFGLALAFKTDAWNFHI